MNVIQDLIRNTSTMELFAFEEILKPVIPSRSPIPTFSAKKGLNSSYPVGEASRGQIHNIIKTSWIVLKDKGFGMTITY